MKSKPKITCSILLDLMIDFALIGMGILIYCFFYIIPLEPLGLNPILIRLVGDKFIAVALIAGIPFTIGLLNLARTVYRVLSALRFSLLKNVQ